MKEDDSLLTFKETRLYLRISNATLYRFMDEGKIVGYKVGSTWRFYERDVRSFVSGNSSTEEAREHERR